MKKTIVQGIVTILVFLGTWCALTQIDWVTLFKIEQATKNTEQKLGELFLDVFKASDKEIKNSLVINPVDSIVAHICSANKIDREKIKVYVLDKDEVNAFALPDGHIVIYSGLILNSNNPEALAGVICHEIAHIELNHVMKKLAKEVGFSVLISMTTGTSGTEIIKETAKMLSSSAVDRSLEREADLKAVEYLVKANVNPEPFANFLYELSYPEFTAAKYLAWISTHPDSKERANYIVELSRDKARSYEPLLAGATWDKLKMTLSE